MAVSAVFASKAGILILALPDARKMLPDARKMSARSFAERLSIAAAN